MPKILIVDDEEDIRKEASEYFVDHGYIVKSAADGEEALRRIETETFDAVISDLIMPNCRGDELATRARALQPTLPIIIIAGTYKDVGVDQLRSAGANEIFRKPVGLLELRTSIERLIFSR